MGELYEEKAKLHARQAAQYRRMAEEMARLGNERAADKYWARARAHEEKAKDILRRRLP